MTAPTRRYSTDSIIEAHRSSVGERRFDDVRGAPYPSGQADCRLQGRRVTITVVGSAAHWLFTAQVTYQAIQSRYIAIPAKARYLGKYGRGEH
jgi:hypothetical protein